jgi:hypothetical protein
MNVRLEELFIKCEQCGGRGSIMDRSGSTGRMHMGWTHEGTCLKCGGRGGELTAAGAVFRDFVRLLEQHRDL